MEKENKKIISQRKKELASVDQAGCDFANAVISIVGTFKGEILTDKNCVKLNKDLVYYSVCFLKCLLNAKK